MSQKEKKGLAPKYVIHKSGYHSVKSPLVQKKKKTNNLNQYIIFNTDLAHRKLEFQNEVNVSIEPCLPADDCYSLYAEVNKEAASYIQKYFRYYFKNHPMKVHKSVQPRSKKTPKRVVLELK